MATFKTLKQSLKGLIYKFKIDFSTKSQLPSLKTTDRTPKIIVSVTSYGRRVNSILYYTIRSILNQTIQPDRIIIWLDRDKWNDSNIPDRISILKNNGVEIAYCKDLRSYTKLIPAHKTYEEDIIITIDDDVVYPPTLIESLYNSYIKDPQAIHCALAKSIIYENDILSSYNNWPNANHVALNIFPLGYGGVLYPPHSLHAHTVDERKFMELCPYADDVWFYTMAKLQGTKHHFVGMNRDEYLGVDNFNQFFHKGNALAHFNVIENGNDRQIQNIQKHYSIKF